MLLSIDTSRKIGSISIADENKIIFQQSFNNINSHSQYLPLLVKNALMLFGKTIKDIKKIVVCDGPGSFTGLRISFAYAQGLALGQEIKKYKVSSLLSPTEYVNKNFPDIQKFYSIVNIKKNYSIFNLIDVKTGTFLGESMNFESNKATLDPSIPIIADTKIENLQNAKINFFDNNIVFSSYIAELILNEKISSRPDEEIFSPTYFKLSDAEYKRNKGI